MNALVYFWVFDVGLATCFVVWVVVMIDYAVRRTAGRRLWSVTFVWGIGELSLQERLLEVAIAESRTARSAWLQVRRDTLYLNHLMINRFAELERQRGNDVPEAPPTYEDRTPSVPMENDEPLPVLPPDNFPATGPLWNALPFSLASQTVDGGSPDPLATPDPDSVPRPQIPRRVRRLHHLYWTNGIEGTCYGRCHYCSGVRIPLVGAEHLQEWLSHCL